MCAQSQQNEIPAKPKMGAETDNRAEGGRTDRLRIGRFCSPTDFLIYRLWLYFCVLFKFKMFWF